MKLEDIKVAVKNSVESEFKRAFYNAAAVISQAELFDLFKGLNSEVYEVGTSRPSD